MQVQGGYAKYKVEDKDINMKPLFETIMINHIPEPKGDKNKPGPIID